jgi:hypothetical protein
MEKNRQAAEEIRKRTKSTLTPVIELLALDSKLKGNKPSVELKSKEEYAITPEQRQRMEANRRQAFLKKQQREKIRAQAAVRPKLHLRMYRMAIHMM